MTTVLNAHFEGREVTIKGNTYSNVSGDIFINFDRDSLTFTCDYCELKGIPEKDLAYAEKFLRCQYEMFVLADSLAAKEKKIIGFEYRPLEDLNVEKIK